MEITELELRSEPAEIALMGAVGHQPDAVAAVLAGLPGGDFYRPARGAVWDVCRALSADRRPVDPVAVARRVSADGGLTAAVRHILAVEMTGGGDGVLHAAAHASVVADLARRRELLQVVNRVRSVVTDHPGDTPEVLARVRELFDGVETPSEDPTGPKGWDSLVDEFERVHTAGAQPGVPSPWPELDQVIGGLFPGRVYVVGGRPGLGKTTTALIIAMHAATEHGKRVLVVSKEMPSVDVTGRLLARGAEVPLMEINARRLSDTAMARIRRYVDRVGSPAITVDDRSRNLSGIIASARSHHHRHGLDVLVVDYLQLVRTDTVSRTREQEVSEVSRQLKALALELGLVVVVPAQLNRGSLQRADPRPAMSDLRDSGQIEQDADAVILLHRPLGPEGDPTGRILMIVDKNRYGPTAEVSLRWRGGYGAIG